MDDINFWVRLGRAVAGFVWGAISVFKSIFSKETPGEKPPPRSTSTKPTDVPNSIPQDLLRSYRCIIGNCTTTMGIMDYLAKKGENIETRLIAEIERIIRKMPKKMTHIRPVEFMLWEFDTGFLSTKTVSGVLKICITPLGRQAYKNILDKDNNPPATGPEYLGYRNLIGKYSFICAVLTQLISRHRLLQHELLNTAIDKYKGVIDNQSIESVLDNVLRILSVGGLINKENNSYGLTDLGECACSDLNITGE